MKKSVLFVFAWLLAFTVAFGQVNLFYKAPNGVTTTQVRAPNGISTYAYLRACALVLPAELTSLPVNSTITVFGFTLSSSTNVNTTGNFTVYLENTANTTYQKGTNWPTIITGMTTVYASTMSLTPTTTSVTLNLSTPFVYTGGGIYVAYDWYSAGPYSTTPATYYAEGTVLAPGCASANSATASPVTLGTTAFRPNFLFGVNNPYTNEISILNIEAPGTLAGSLGTTNTVKALIRNGSGLTLNNIPLTLNVSGANPFANTQTVSSLAPGATTLIAFPAYTPVNSGLSTLSVSVPPDNINTNNSRVYTQSVTCSEWALNPAAVSYTHDAIGFNTGSGIIAVAYSNTATSTLTGVKAAISTNTPSIGNNLWGVLLNSAGAIVATTNTVAITNSVLGSFTSFSFATPPVLNGGSNYYIGFAQPANASGYFPMGTYTTNPSPYINYVTTTTVGGTPAPLTSDLGYLGIQALFMPTLSVSAASQTVTCGTQAILAATSAGTYTWVSGPANANYSVTPISSTTYSVNTSTTYGCAASNTVQVTVNPINVTASSSSPSVCAGKTITITGAGATSYTWNTTPATNTASFTPSPTVTTTYSVLGANPNGCKNGAVVTVTANPNPTLVTTSQTVVCGTQATLTTTSSHSYTWASGPSNADYLVTPTVNTTYSVTAITPLGCSASKTVAVAVNPITVTVSSSSPSVCSGNSVAITAGGATSYTWDLVPVSGASFVTNPTANSTFSVQGSNSAGCSGSASVGVIVHANPTITTSPQTVLCGTQASLNATSSDSYTWTSGPANADLVVTPTINTTYSVTATTTAGCVQSSTVLLSVDPITVTANSSAPAICLGNTVSLIAAGATSFTWNTTPVVNTAGLTDSPTVTTVYSVQAENTAGCAGTASVLVTVNSFTSLNVSANSLTTCAGSAVTATASGAATYTWITGTATLNTAAITQTPATNGIYTVSASGANGCIDSQTLSIMVNAAPVVTVSASIMTLCIGESSTLTAGGAVSYTWAGNSSPDNTLVVTPAASGSSDYTVTGANTQLCAASAVVSIIADACTGIGSINNVNDLLLVYPNPNNGNVNLVFTNAPENTSVRIVNMLGERVADFHTTETHSSIDLTSMANGVYFILVFQAGKPLNTIKIIKE